MVVVLGYIVYSKRIDKNVIKSDPSKATPAKMYMDGVDFTPTSRNVLFGGSNQLMASLALMIVSLWLIKTGKAHQWVSYPAIFMYITTIAALGYTSFTAFSKIAIGQLPSDRIIGSAVAGVISIFLIIAALILAYDGISAIIKVRRSRSQAVESPTEL